VSICRSALAFHSSSNSSKHTYLPAFPAFLLAFPLIFWQCADRLQLKEAPQTSLLQGDRRPVTVC
jgi:hypothetical protein